MKKVLGIIGSPRKLGNCEIMIKEISNNISQPHELKLLRLPDFNILPCKACYRCLFNKKRCIQKDDFGIVLNSIIDADVIIVAAPAYFLGANSSLKLFLDRGLAFYAHIEKLWNKPAAGVAIAGIKGKEGYTLLNIESFINLILADNKLCTTIYGALPGEIFLNEENKRTAQRLAAALFKTSSEKKEPQCPLCGGNTFRFLGNNRVRCMLCSNDGTFTVHGDTIVFEVTKGVHEFFLSKEDAIDHRAWLIGMKDRFIKEKNRLKEISLSYRKGGEWIMPGGK